MKEEDYEKLKRFASEHNLTQTEAIEKGLDLLYQQYQKAELRKKEQELMKDQFDGIDSAKARTVEYIHIALHSVFEMAIKDEIIRQNPTHGIMAQVKKKTGYLRETKAPLTMAQQEKSFPTPTISGMTGFIFVNEEGRLRSPEAINRAIDTITRWCNKEEEQKAQEESREPIIIPHFSCHVFRHTFCTRFYENETNIKVI